MSIVAVPLRRLLAFRVVFIIRGAGFPILFLVPHARARFRVAGGMPVAADEKAARILGGTKKPGGAFCAARRRSPGRRPGPSYGFGRISITRGTASVPSSGNTSHR